MQPANPKTHILKSLPIRKLLNRLLVRSTAFPILIIITFLLTFLTAVNTSTLLREQVQITKSIASQLNTSLTDLERILFSIGATADYINDYDRQLYIDAVQFSNPLIDNLFILSTDGITCSKTPMSSPSCAQINTILQGGGESITRSNFTYDDNPQSSTLLNGKLMIATKTPGGKSIIAFINTENLFSFIENYENPSLKREIEISRQDHSILFSSDKEVITSQSPDVNLDDQLITELIISGSSATLSSRQQRIIISTTSQVDINGWYVKTGIPIWRLIGAYVTALSVMVVTVIFAWLAISLRINRYTLTRVIQPLTKLSLAANALADGDETALAAPEDFMGYFSELDDLSRSFRRMWDGIQSRQQSIFESESKYRGLIEQFNDALSVELNGSVETVNPKFLSFFDVPAGSKPIDCPTISEIVPDEIKVQVRSIIMKILLGQLPDARFEFSYEKDNGKIIDVEASCSPVTYSGCHAIQIIYRDITEKNASTTAEREQRTYAEALTETAAAITSTLNFDEVLGRILSNLHHVVPHEASNIMLLTRNGKTARVVADQGYRMYEMDTWLRTTIYSVADTPNFRQMVESGEPGFISDTKSDPTWVHHPKAAWIRSCAFAPIKVQGKVIGIINVDSSSAGYFTERHARHLLSFANQAGIAIRNAQLLQEVQQSNTDLRLAYDSTLLGWSKALELRDVETKGHSQRVMDLTLQLATRIGVKDADLVNIRYGVLLHDIGKIAIPDSILFNPGGLDEQEWEIMRKHPTFAYELLSPIAYLAKAIDIPYCHHEHWDGSGYPRGLKGEAIPLSARIFAIVDVWDGMTSDRRYRPAMPPEQVITYIEQQSGILFDPFIVEEFTQLLIDRKMISG